MSDDDALNNQPVRQCRTCAWWRPWCESGNGMAPLGKCHIRAPTYGRGFPDTRPEDWCGEWKFER